MSESLSVVVPTYNRCAILMKTLSMLALETGVGEIIVADDGSSDGTRESVEDFAKATPVAVRYRYQPDLGFRAGEARNMGIRAAKNDIILFLDDDCVPVAETVQAHLSFHAARRGCVGLGRRLSLPPSTAVNVTNRFADQREGALSSAGGDRTSHWPFLYSCHFSVRYSDFPIEFDADFHGWGMEDTELGYRLATLGATFEFVPGAYVVHRDEDDLRSPFLRRDHGLEPDYSSYLSNLVRFFHLHASDATARAFALQELRRYSRSPNGAWNRIGQGDERQVLEFFSETASGVRRSSAAAARPALEASDQPSALVIAPYSPEGLSDGGKLNEIIQGDLKPFTVDLVVIPLAELTPPQRGAMNGVRRVGYPRLIDAIDTRFKLIANAMDFSKGVAVYEAHSLPWAARFATPVTARRIDAWLGGVAYDCIYVHHPALAPLVGHSAALRTSEGALKLLNVNDSAARPGGPADPPPASFAAQEHQRLGHLVSQHRNAYDMLVDGDETRRAAFEMARTRRGAVDDARSST